MRTVLALMAALCLSAGIARADAYDDGLTATAELIGARYGHLVGSAEALEERFGALCAAPDAVGLQAVRKAAAEVVRDFSMVELVRFGPARENNRFERLFFWPDRRGRGLRQVQQVLHQQDETALTVDSLRDKSVAVQGLLALDFILNGDGAAVLGEAPAGFRCGYGDAVAGAILRAATNIRDGWMGPDGFAALMENAGPDNPIYHDRGEVAQAWLQAAREQLQVVRELKLEAVIGETPAEAHPKRLPFWRSGLGFATAAANVEGVLELFRDGRLDALLTEEDARLAGELRFELEHALDAIRDAVADGPGDADVAGDPDRHGALRYALSPLGGAVHILGERYPAALGLVAGFNALDGD